MEKLIPLIYVLSVSAIDILLIIGIINLRNKLSNSLKGNVKIARGYYHDIIIGVVSGMIVVTVDRIITNSVNNPPRIDFSSVWSTIGSLIGVFLVVVFVSAFLVISIMYLLYVGVKGISRAKIE
jgi:hypothetical protein